MKINKYNSSSDKKSEGRGSNNSGVANYYSSSSAAQQIIQAENLWKKGNAQGSLVPQGSYNITEGTNSVAIGTETQTTNEGEFAMGVFNISTPDVTLFSIGDGTDNTHRHNVFNVDDEGNTYIAGGLDVNDRIVGHSEIITPKVVATVGDIKFLNSTTVTADEVNATDIYTDNLRVDVRAFIEELFANDITTKNLTVTEAAHFFKLIIDEIKASKGQILITPANATIDLVENISGGYRCYFKATDGDKQIYNTFEVNDQVVCQTFNAAQGTSYNVSNKFYWNKITAVSSNTVTKTIDGQSAECWYVDISSSDKASNTNSIPEVGDEIVQLGNRTDTSRQAAIIISAYNNTYLDSQIQSPSIVQYDGINNFNLSNHRLNVISKSFNQFKGNFWTTSGDDIEDLINNVGEGTTMYIHTAYSTSSNGYSNFSKTYFSTATYIGMCNNFNSSDTDLVYSDYTWMRFRGADGQNGQDGTNGTNGTNGRDGQDGQDGQDGENGEYFALVPIRETFEVNIDGENMGTTTYENVTGVEYVDLIYAIAHVDGSNVTYLNSSEVQNYSINVVSDNTSGLNSHTFTYSGNSNCYGTFTIVNNSNSSNIKTYEVIRIKMNNYLTWINNSGNANYNNFYYLHANNLSAWMPTVLNIRLLRNGTEVDAKEIPLIFKPSHVFSVSDSSLNSIYQGLSGTTGKWTTTGFSNIRQTWENINLSVNNIKSLEYGENINNTKNQNPTTEQFAFYRKSTSTAPSAPSGTVSSTSSSVNETWTLNTGLAPTSTYQYEFITKRTRVYDVATGLYGTWSSWSTPVLYWIYNVPRSSVNSAQLNIEADKIESSVKSSIKVGGNNLIMNGAFDKLTSGAPDYWSNWGTPSNRYIYTDDTGHNWMYIISNNQWQGYRQDHYNDGYNIRIEGGKTYTLSFRARAASGTPKLQVVFHWWNDTQTYTQYAANAYPQYNIRNISIDTEDKFYSFTFKAVQESNGSSSNDNLYVYNGSSYVSTGKPAQGFQFMIGSGVTGSQAFYITDVTLVQGDIPQQWFPSLQETGAVTESKITQTANNIELSIKSALATTGINIDTHNITLNADKTTINGQLELNQTTNDGFKLNATDSNGTARNCYVTAGMIDDYATWNNKAAGVSNCITALGSNGFEFISTIGGNFPGNKAYIGDNGITFVASKAKFDIESTGLYQTLPYKDNTTIRKHVDWDYIKYVNNSYEAHVNDDIIVYTYSSTSTNPKHVISLGNNDSTWNGKKYTIKNWSKVNLFIAGLDASGATNMVPTYSSDSGARNSTSTSPYFNKYRYVLLKPGCTITFVYNCPASGGTYGYLWMEISNSGWQTGNAPAYGTNSLS